MVGPKFSTDQIERVVKFAESEKAQESKLNTETMVPVYYCNTQFSSVPLNYALKNHAVTIISNYANNDENTLFGSVGRFLYTNCVAGFTICRRALRCLECWLLPLGVL
jgi:predicted glycosyltransferase involved in capsule biosynthesis